ncbi:MAG TPA: NADH-quinone oxidoreductase subunit L [Verrucomicrobiae bacterium]|nr:NADH-quinone oxidoreductase subunit L [Verrucomicrobiae bacterium]
MDWILRYLWLIPALPLAAAGLSAVASRGRRVYASSLAIGAMLGALALSILALFHACRLNHSAASVSFINFRWLQFGDGWLRLGWMLDPLTAIMLVMICAVALLVFIYSLGYMARDENFTRFFCCLSLFAAAMLGLVIANSLLLLFMCWELVGLTSYLLIGFWYHKPEAVAAAKKAFITTRAGDMALLLGMVWLYSQAGTLLFYDHGHGCMESAALARLVAQPASLGFAAATGISLLIFCGAVGKSGQLPLHTWLPDAMEGPTPVSALIHAATMVAAGVFLVARTFPLMAAHAGPGTSAALQVVAWVGAITAVFAATIAVAQTDIKRVLAYSTISQLGFMMLGLGTGGVAVGIFHLVTHAFFKALLFLGAGSVIHGCHEQQDMRWMGGLRRIMPVTFATYAVGMLSLCGFPLVFSGFWSKDEILHAAHRWPLSQWPFYLGVVGALLTAFYMTRQVLYVFFGRCRLFLGKTTASEQRTVEHGGEPASEHPASELPPQPAESPAVMTLPLVVLAVFAIGLGFLGTPAWPWFQRFLGGEAARGGFGALASPDVLLLMGVSAAMVLAGIGLGWWMYGWNPCQHPGDIDVLERRQPDIFTLLRRKYFVDEIYEWLIVRLNAWWACACDLLDIWLWGALVQLVSAIVIGLAWVDRMFDEKVINGGFDLGCSRITRSGGFLSFLQNGRVQSYLKVIGLGLAVLLLILIFSAHGP